MLAAGYVRSGRQHPQPGYRPGRGKTFDSTRTQGFRQPSVSNQKQGPKKDINPTGSDGRLLTCKSCGSFRHMINDCEHSWENMDKVSLTEHDVLSTAVSNTSEHGVLFTGFQRGDVFRLCRDAQNCAVLDSACSSTACGQTWFNNYLESLTRDQREKITWKDSKKVFKFGGGTCLTSKGEYSIPAVLAERNVIIQTDIVESVIPLLLSRDSMKRRV